MGTTLESTRTGLAAPRNVVPADAAALAVRLADALERIAEELVRLRVLLEEQRQSERESVHAETGPWLRHDGSQEPA